MSKKYPSGPINQHKDLATGGSGAKGDTSKKGGGFEEKGGATKGGVHKNGRA